MKSNGAIMDHGSRRLSSIAQNLLYTDAKMEDEGKKHCRLRPDHAVHLIPLVLIFCGLILWLATTTSPFSIQHVQKESSNGDVNALAKEISNGRSWRAINGEIGKVKDGLTEKNDPNPSYVIRKIKISM
eukprot:Gb_34953 [translate_table: standard]